MGRIGLTEIIFVVLIIIILFGVKKLPEIGNALGKAIREFRKAGKEIEEDVKEVNQDSNNEKQT